MMYTSFIELIVIFLNKGRGANSSRVRVPTVGKEVAGSIPIFCSQKKKKWELDREHPKLKGLCLTLELFASLLFLNSTTFHTKNIHSQSILGVSRIGASMGTRIFFNCFKLKRNAYSGSTLPSSSG